MSPFGKRQYGLRYLLILLLIACTVCAPVASARGADAEDSSDKKVEQHLERGKAVQRSVTQGEVHRYTLDLAAGESVSVVFKKHGTALVASLFAPDGAKLHDFSIGAGNEGEDRFSFVAANAGSYRLDVRSISIPTPPGRYEVVLLEQGRGIADESPAKPSPQSCRERSWRDTSGNFDIAQILNAIGDCMAVVGGKAGDQQGNTRSLVDFTRAEVALLSTRWQRGEAVSAAYQESLQADLRALALAEQEKDRKKAYEVMREVADDLQIKARHSNKISRGLGKDVMVRVTTTKGGKESRGWVVYYRPRVAELAADGVVQRFQKVSSPTQQPLPPGKYLMWVGTPNQPEPPQAQKQLVEVGGGRTRMNLNLSAP